MAVRSRGGTLNVEQSVEHPWRMLNHPVPIVGLAPPIIVEQSTMIGEPTIPKVDDDYSGCQDVDDDCLSLMICDMVVYW